MAVSLAFSAFAGVVLCGCPGEELRAEFVGAPRSGVAPLEVAFSDASSGGEISAWAWEFGDGESSEEQHPTHVYGSSGTFDVTMRVSSAGGDAQVVKEAFVVVSAAVDTVAPVISLNGDAEVTLECGEAYVDAGATAVDAEEGEVAVSVQGLPVQGAPGDYTIVYTAKDAAGNAAAPVERVVHVRDTVAPVISIAGGEVALACGDPYVDAGATAADACAGTVVVSASGSEAIDGAGDYAITYSATDASGNTATAVRVVTVSDVTPPEISLVGGDMILECGESFDDPGAVALDNCDAAPAIGVDGVVGAVVGEYALIYTARDAAGNVSVTLTRQVQVVDTETPVITLNALELTWECGSPFTTAATAVDACDGPVDVAHGGPANFGLIQGRYEIYNRAGDTAGNVTSAKQIVHVDDTTPPRLMLRGSPAIELPRGTVFGDPGAVAVDTCDGAREVRVHGDVVNIKVPGVYTLSYHAWDTSGNGAPPLTRAVTVYEPCSGVAPWSGLYGEAEGWSEVVQMLDCGFVIASSLPVWVYPQDPGVHLRKLSADGELEWDLATSFQNWHLPTLVRLDDGDLLLAGSEYAGEQPLIKLTRFFPNGNERWTARLAAARQGVVGGVCEMDNGDLWIVHSQPQPSPLGDYVKDTTVFVADRHGTLIDTHLVDNLDARGIARRAYSGALLFGRFMASDGTFDSRWGCVPVEGSGHAQRRIDYNLDGAGIRDVAPSPGGAVLTGTSSFAAMSVNQLGRALWVYVGLAGGAVSVNPQGEVAVVSTEWLGAGVVATKLAANGTPLWTRLYGRGDTIGQDVAATFDGGMIITSESGEWLDRGRDLYVLKTDADGNVPDPEIPETAGWMNRYRLPQEVMAGPLTVRPGGYAFVTREVSPEAPAPVWLVQTDEAGVPVRHETISGGGDLAAGLVADGAEGFVIGGARRAGDGSLDRYVIRVDSNGSRYWNHTLAGSGEDGFAAVAAIGEGRFVAAGHREGENGDPLPCAVRVDLNGALVWDRVYDGRVGGAFAAALAVADGVVLAGRSGAGVGRLHYAVKLDAAGDPIWEHQYGIGKQGELTCFTATADGGYLFAGSATNAESVNSIVLFRSDGAGVPIWPRLIDLGHWYEAKAVLERADGSVLLALGDSRYTSLDFYRVGADGQGLERLKWSNIEAGARTTLLPVADGGIVYNGWDSVDEYAVPALLRLTAELETDRYFSDFVLE